MPHKGVVLAVDPAHDDRRVRGGLLVVELVALAGGTALDPAKPPHKVKVPVAAAELAVRDDVQAGRLLLCHEVADGDVLYGRELLVRDEAGRVVRASLLEDVRPEEAADHVEAEGGVVLVGHVKTFRLGCCLLARGRFFSPGATQYRPYQGDRKLSVIYQYL